MSQVLVQFDTAVSSADGTQWIPRVCGQIADDNLWEGWIEFTAADESREPVRTPRETEQPNRDDLMYWATGLTRVYLQDALVRAIRPPSPVRGPRSVSAVPHFDGPALRSPGLHPTPGRRAVLDPLKVYQQGEDVLLSTLSALDAPRLRDIAGAYGFSSIAAADGMNREHLTASILAGVRRPFAERDAESGEQPRK